MEELNDTFVQSYPCSPQIPCVGEAVIGGIDRVVDRLVIPKEGMTFDSIAEAFLFYKAFGYRVGFGVKKRTSHTFEGIRCRYTFTCRKEGKSNTIIETTKVRRKPISRTGCKAKMVIVDQYLNGNWKVHELGLEHNHELNPEMVRFMKCYRELPVAVKVQLEVNDSAGVPLNKSINAMILQGGGYENCSCTEKDCRNHISQQRQLRLGEGDAQALLHYFEKMQEQNSCFFYTMQLTDNGQLKNVFWADARSRAAYEYFGDIISFDTTYLTNEFALPFAPFVGVNHHGQSILFGCALLADETTETFKWLFSVWLSCMHGVVPKGIITDQCRSMSLAIADIFPETRHRFCLWGIMRKLPEKLGRRSDREVISMELSHLVYETLSVPEFERKWDLMISNHSLHNLEWFCSLYSERDKWVPVYLKDHFWAGMSITQRSESMNSFFDEYVTSKTSLKVFVEQYDEALRSKYENESLEDFRSFHSRPQLISPLRYEAQVADLYTLKMFSKFQVEVRGLIQCMCSFPERNGPANTYVVSEFDGSRTIDFRVIYDSCAQEVWCICRSFQFMGILCRHSLCVLRQERVIELPISCLLDRWKKDYKRRHARLAIPRLATSCRTNLYDELYAIGHKFFIQIIELGSADAQSREVAITALKHAAEHVVRFSESRTLTPDLDLPSIQPFNQEHIGSLLLDPPCAHPKGRPPTKRLKGIVEPSTRKRKNVGRD